MTLGMHERHLQRKDGNPLFAVVPHNYTAAEYRYARDLDNHELDIFESDIREVIHQAVDLPFSPGNHIVPNLLSKLNQLYIRCSGFDGGCDDHKQSIRKLIEIVMGVMWRDAAVDPKARRELEEKELVRQKQFCLLEYPLVSDLMRSDTMVEEEELIPTLLQANEDELEAVLWIFEAEQLRVYQRQARDLLLLRRAQGYELRAAWNSLALISERID